MHVSTSECFLAVGCWHPAADMLGRIRDRIVNEPDEWFSIRDDASFAAHWRLSGDSLRRPPRGYAAGHPAIDDLKRKDFIGMAPLALADVTAPGLVELAANQFAAARSFMAFLCAALEVPY